MGKTLLRRPLVKPFDWNAGRNWLPLFTATRINLGSAYWLDEIGGIDWSGLPMGWLVR